SDDHVRNVVVEIVAALRANDHAKLRKYAEARKESPTLPFLAWLAVVARRIAIDYMRRQGEYVDLRRTPGAEIPGAWIELVTLQTCNQGAGRPPVTNLAAAQALLEHADAHCSIEQAQALRRWSQGDSYAEIGRELNLDGPKAAERLVQGAVERLRRH